MKLIAMLLLSGLTLSNQFSIPTNKISAGNTTFTTQDDQAEPGYSAVGEIVKEGSDSLVLLTNPCGTDPKPFYAKFKKPYTKKAVDRPACPNGRKINYVYVEQQGTPTKQSDAMPQGNRTAPLAVNAIEPSRGNSEGGTTVIIQGEGFTTGTRVLFAGAQAKSTVSNNGKSMTIVTPAHPIVRAIAYQRASAPVKVEVKSPNGKSVVLDDGFVYEEARIGAVEVNVHTRSVPKNKTDTLKMTLEYKGAVLSETEQLGNGELWRVDTVNKLDASHLEQALHRPIDYAQCGSMTLIVQKNVGANSWEGSFEVTATFTDGVKAPLLSSTKTYILRGEPVRIDLCDPSKR